MISNVYRNINACGRDATQCDDRLFDVPCKTSSAVELISMNWIKNVVIDVAETVVIAHREVRLESATPNRAIDFLLYQPATLFNVVTLYLSDEPVISDRRPYVVDLVWREMH